MDLVTEYHKRNAVQSPLIRYAPNSHLLVRLHNNYNLKNKWAFISIFLVNKDGVPGTFQICEMQAVHDAFRNNRSCFNPIKDNKVIWDDYENFIHQLASNYKDAKVISGKDELILSYWEVFLFALDSLLAELSTTYLEDIHDSLNMSLVAAERLNYVMAFFNHIKSNQDTGIVSHAKLILSAWATLEHHINNYDFWLADLFNKKK